jgi:hypothetical protein
MFDAKDTVKDYIATLPIISAFFAAGSFMQNCESHWLPRSMGDSGLCAFYDVQPPATKIPLINIAVDTGKWVGAHMLKINGMNNSSYRTRHTPNVDGLQGIIKP